MSSAVDGDCFIDLSGNRVVWNNADQHDNIYLVGSQFTETLPMATMAISALCLLCFIIVSISVCCVCCARHRHAAKYLPWGAVWVPVFCMILFFLLDICNRVMHEKQLSISSAYIGIDVPLGSLANTADGLLQLYLLKYSPVNIATGGVSARLIMAFALVVYAVVCFSARGSQIWDIVQQVSGSGDQSTFTGPTKQYDHYFRISREVWQDCAAAASGMILLFAIGYTIFAVGFIRTIPPTHSIAQKNEKRLRWAVGFLAGGFLGRNVVIFVFALYYTRFNHVASMGAQLAYLAIYGLGSVACYASIVMIAGVQEARDTNVGGWRPSPVQQTSYNGSPEYSYIEYQHAPKA